MAASLYEFAFRPHEKPSHGCLRLLRNFARAARRLQKPLSRNHEEAVHEVRVLIKRLRALIWLARPALTPATLSSTKADLRKASRLLAASRDRTVLQKTLKKLADKAESRRDKAACTEVARTSLAQLNTGKDSESLPAHSLTRSLVFVLQAITQFAATAPKNKEAWPSPSDRVKKAFRGSRAVGHRALKSGKPPDFHEWRKKAKRLLYELKTTHPRPNRHLGHLIKKMDKLQDKLGEYHDSVVVHERVRALVPDLPATKRVSSLLIKRQKHLKKRTKKIARQLESLR